MYIYLHLIAKFAIVSQNRNKSKLNRNIKYKSYSCKISSKNQLLLHLLLSFLHCPLMASTQIYKLAILFLTQMNYKEGLMFSTRVFVLMLQHIS